MTRTGVSHRERSRGQTLALFAVSLVALILAVGLVIDGGNALAQRRASQNASDLAALAGARIVAEHISGDNVNGTDANAVTAITTVMSANGAAALTFGSPSGPRYVDSNGAFTGWVGGGSIPANTVGVRLSSSRSWSPFFLRLVGFTTWTASADATARGGYSAEGPPGAVFPAGVAEAFFQGSPCSGPVSTDPTSPCHPTTLTPGNLNVPGGFGWLDFGCQGPDANGKPFGLGQVPPANVGGCNTNTGFLQTEIGPPSQSFGCCTAVGLPGSGDDIGSLPGDKNPADCSSYVNSGITVTVPVWDSAGGTGSNAYYHIVGFTGWQITGCNGGKDLEGVWRQPIWSGPTTTTPGFAGEPLAVQLIR